VLLFTLGATMLSALLFGMAPALRAVGTNLADALKERGTEMGGMKGNKLRTTLVVLEVALSLVLLIGAGLMLRSFAALQRVDPGFRTHNVLTFSVPLPFFKYRDANGRIDFYGRLRERIETLPGVEAAGSVTPLPLAGGDQYFVFSYGPPGVTDEEWSHNRADYRWAQPGYFEAMGIRLVAGRFFDEADNQEGALEVALIDETLARRIWPDQNPVGQQLQVEKFDVEDFSMTRTGVRVAGVVGHVRSESLAAEGREAIYFPLRNFPYAPQSLAIRASVDPLGLVPAIRNEVASLDPDVPIADVRLMDSYVAEAMAQTRFTLTLIALFAGLALVLASIGLYGVISYSVRQRTPEIGVRMAFGAAEGNIVRLVLGQGMILALAGVAVGLLAAFLLTRTVSSLLFGVTPRDPVTFVGIPLFLILVAAIASYFPARRALRVDPVDALRGE
jgi:putative ABC transport system permease protein